MTVRTRTQVSQSLAPCLPLSDSDFPKGFDKIPHKKAFKNNESLWDFGQSDHGERTDLETEKDTFLHGGMGPGAFPKPWCYEYFFLDF